MGINSRLNELEKKIEELESIKQIGSTLKEQPKKKAKSGYGLIMFIIGVIFGIVLVIAIMNQGWMPSQYLNYICNMTG